MLLYFLCVPKYRNIKLGKDTDEPEFSYLQWFSMVFAAGVAVGLFFFGVAEPMWHFHGWGGARWMDADMSDTEKANHALMVTYFHWGFHGWVPYVVIGALMSIMSWLPGSSTATGTREPHRGGPLARARSRADHVPRASPAAPGHGREPLLLGADR